MKKIIIYSLSLIATLWINALSAQKEPSNFSQNAEIKKEVKSFLDNYLDAYNKRIAKETSADEFIRELSVFLNTPFIIAPPKSASRYPETFEQKKQSFDGFVKSLHKKNAVKLQWREVKLRVLTDNKVLANNVGEGVDHKGRVVYETVSVYLIRKGKDGWKIVLFSPYDINNKIEI